MVDVFKDIIFHYLEEHPETYISHNLTSNGQIMNLLRGNDVDFVITPEPIDDPQVDCFPLFEDEVFANVGADHPLFTRDTVTLEELAVSPVICDQCCNRPLLCDRDVRKDRPDSQCPSGVHRTPDSGAADGRGERWWVCAWPMWRRATCGVLRGRSLCRIVEPEIRRTVSISMRRGAASPRQRSTFTSI